MSASPATPRPSIVWGPLTATGLLVAVAVFVLDQASKLWLLQGFDLAQRGRVPVLPFLDLILVWNRGVSYGWFQQEGATGATVLLAFKLVVAIGLWVWLARTGTRLSALALGLLIGGALGNALDRAVYGAVVDFVLLHITTATWRFHWYVFNIADVAIVAGVAVLLYESLVGERAVKAP